MSDSDISSMKADIKKAATDIKVNIFQSIVYDIKTCFLLEKKDQPFLGL